MYAYILDGDDSCVKKNKGVNGAVVRKLNFDKYYKCLDLSKTFYNDMCNLVSNKHNVYTQIKRKKILCGKDEKRYISQDGINTLAWGHYEISDFNK